MTMMRGNQYRQSIQDGRRSFIDGERVEDASCHPLLRVSVDWVAGTYDRFHSSEPGAQNPMYTVPRTTAELEQQMAVLTESDLTAATTAGCMALVNVAPELGEVNPAYRERLERFLAHCRETDVRVAAARDDAGGVRVVERRPDGVVIHGAKRHVLGAAVVHELVVVPPRQMSGVEAELAIACAVPVAAPGVKVVSVTTAPRGEDTRHHPISRVHSIPDSLVVFDNVLVPWERVFLDGEVEHSGALAETLGVWERARAVAAQADEAELLLGLAQTIAEMNGVPDASHIRDKLSAMAVYATMCRAGWEAALAHAVTTPAGMVAPADSYIYATKSYGGNLFSEMAGYLHDIAGALVITVPTVADYDNPATHAYMEKYLRTMNGVAGEDRMRIFHLIRDMTADCYGGWAKVTNQMVAGGIYAQRAATLHHYDLPRVKAKARAAAGITRGANGAKP